MLNQKTEGEQIGDKTNCQSERLFPKTEISAFYGSKLFIKIFFWFCFTTITALSLAAGYVYCWHYKPAREEFMNITMEILQDNGKIMVDAYEQQGIKALEKFKGPGNSWLFNEELEDVFEQIPGKKNYFKQKNGETAKLGGVKSNASSSVKYESGNHYKLIFKNYVRKEYEGFYKANQIQILNFAKRLFEEKKNDILAICKENFVGCQFASESGKKYVAIVHVPKKIPGHESFLFFNSVIDMMPIFILIYAILCFAIARYLAKPIIELKTASRKFAKGDFSVKISEWSKGRRDELGDLAIDFNDMAEKIESGINSQRRLFNDISHELRSPLARMQVSIELLQMKLGGSEKSLIGRLEKDINRMNALIGELLQFSKLENKEIGCCAEEVELGKALEEVCSDAEFEGRVNRKRVRLEIKQKAVVKGNSDLLERAFENIIRNALRFTPENSVVEVSLDKSADKAVVVIADQGPGVPEEEMTKVFAPFYCVKLDRNPQVGGIGLGLSIALRAVQLHKGSITMENRPEGGLAVTIELPVSS